MRIRKIEITAELAHFKKPYVKKQQFTYEIPTISTVAGIMQNLFNKDIDDFIFGYIFENNGVFKDIQRIWKEINPNVRKLNDTKRGNSDVCEIHYLIEPRLVIYTNIFDKMIINECLNLGKTDCLAKVVKDEIIEVEKQQSKGYNQWTDLSIESESLPERIAIETRYNGGKGYYDIYTKLLRRNKEFDYYGYYDNDEEQNIYLWNWKRGGILSEFN